MWLATQSERTLGDQRHVAAQAEMAEAGVEEQVAVAPAHVPDVAAEERLDPGLMDQRHAVGHADRLVPLAAAYDRQNAHSRLTFRAE